MSFSGRYPEHDICENFNAIDVRELQRKTGLRPGLCFIKKWFRNGAPAGEVFIFTQPDAKILAHRVCPPGATKSRIVELQVPIIWTKCHLGGRRPWFKCLTTINGEVCGRRVAKLYGPCFACRRCLGLGYASQREIPLRRAGRRAQMIKMRLGGSNDPLEPLPQKPRGMHWRTYLRLRDQAHAAMAEADYSSAESFPGLGQFLHPMPPRRKRQRGRRDGGPTEVGLPCGQPRPSVVQHASQDRYRRWIKERDPCDSIPKLLMPGFTRRLRRMTITPFRHLGRRQKPWKRGPDPMRAEGRGRPGAEVLVVSLTQVHVPRAMPLAAAVADYRKHRVKKLKKQGRP
jgi:hypothetical protein